MVPRSTRMVTKPHRIVIFMLLKVLWSCLPRGNSVLLRPLPPFAVGLIQPSTAPFAMGWVGCILVGNTTDPAHRVRPKGIFLFWIYIYIFFWIRTLSLLGLYNYIYKPFMMGFFFVFTAAQFLGFEAIVFQFSVFNLELKVWYFFAYVITPTYF